MLQLSKLKNIRFGAILLLSGLILSSCAGNKVNKSGLKNLINYLNTLGMEFVLIPSGAFIMGANSRKEEATSLK